MLFPRTKQGVGVLIGFALLPIVTVFVHMDSSAQESGPSDPNALHLSDWPTSPAATRGRVVYDKYCVGCHGQEGDGNGTAAPFLNPKPRDFQHGAFKFRSTPYGAPPTRDDVFRTVTCGLPGSSMPGFPLVDARARRDVVEYVLHLYAFGKARIEVEYLKDDEGLSMDQIRGERLEELQDEITASLDAKSTPVAVAAMPPATPELLARGKQLFEQQCGACHGATGIGDGASSYTLRDWKDSEVRPRDFTTGVFRAGSTPRDLYIRMRTGLSGTPMPAFSGSDEDVWGLIHFIGSLRDPNAPAPKHVSPGCGGMEVDR